MATNLMSRFIKKAASSSVVQLENRFFHRKNYTSGAIFTTPMNTSTSNITTNLFGKVIPTHHQFSSLAEKISDSNHAILSVIEAAINCAEEKSHEFVEVPREFPCNIEDNARGEPLILTREYQGEKIEVKVFTSNSNHCFGLVVMVSNKSRITLEFHITADAKLDAAIGFKITSMDVRDPGYSYPLTDFSGLDEKLQKAFRTYLEVRGIEPSITKFIYDCMEKKRHKKCAAWLTDFTKLLKNSTTTISTSNSATDNIFGKVSRPTSDDHTSALDEKRSSSDDTFLRVVESEIDRAKKEFHEVPKAPREFPFEMDYWWQPNTSYSTMELTREYQGEEIQVKVKHFVYVNDSSGDNEEEEHSRDNQEAEKQTDRQHVFLDISVSRKNGLTMLFDVVAYADRISINSLSVDNPNDSDDYSITYEQHFFPENFHKAFQRYLEVRGFEPSNTKFLCNYMYKKVLFERNERYTRWLNNLKDFIVANRQFVQCADV